MAVNEEQKQLLDRGLPKWPQMIVTGESITQEQAKEIIRRTDYFLHGGHGGNDRVWNKRAIKLLKMPHGFDMDPDQPKIEDYSAHFEECDTWRDNWGCINLEYLSVGWLSAAALQGPHGWIHPTGMIGYVDNIGKHPYCETVFEEWAVIAHEFPFLKIGMTLMDRECCEDGERKVISMMISDGTVKAYDPEKIDVHEGHPAATRSPINKGDDHDRDFANVFMIHESIREHGVPWSWMEDWEKAFFKDQDCPQCDAGKEKPFHNCETCHGDQQIRVLKTRAPKCIESSI